jgi:protein SCO1/2
MRNRAAVFWLAVLFLFAGAITCWTAWRMLGRASGLEPVVSSQVPDKAGAAARTLVGVDRLTAFTLTDQRGEAFQSAQLVGKVWIASFFYTSCPSVCRMQNSQVANLQRDYQTDEDVHLVSITCDPVRDTPATLAQYAELFGANPDRWHFLTGDFELIKAIGQLMKTSVEQAVHSDRLFVIDRQGIVRGGFRSTEPEQMAELKTMVGRLLAEGAAVPPLVPQGDAGEPQSVSSNG